MTSDNKNTENTNKKTPGVDLFRQADGHSCPLVNLVNYDNESHARIDLHANTDRHVTYKYSLLKVTYSVQPS